MSQKQGFLKQELMERIINKINSEMTYRTNGKDFAIIKYEPGNILLLHKPTKKAFQYQEPCQEIPLLQRIVHPSLIRPIIYNKGLLYPRGLSTLETELENRRRAHNPIPFEQTEIANTFLPILDCLQFLHKNGIVHGSVSPKNIIFTNEQDIKIKDWMTQVKENIYYSNKQRKEITSEDDLVAFGQILAQASTLKKGTKIFQDRDLNSILVSIIDRFSKGFIFALAVLLKKNKERFNLLQNYFNNEDKYLTDLQLNSLYDSIKKEHDKKKHIMVSDENVMPHPILKKGITSLTESPIKKSTPNNSLNNTMKRTKDDQNKKIHNEETKKKQIQKINKIIERSNEFVNELMARKNHQHILKKIAPKPNISVNVSHGPQITKRTVKEVSIQSSPIKRIRTNSKKK